MQTVLAQLLSKPDFPEHDIWQRESFTAKDVIIQEGGLDQRIYLVEQGELSVTSTVDLADNRKVRPGIHTLQPGQIFGEFCLYNDLPRTATVTATQDGQLIVFDALKLQQYLDQHPETGYQVLKEIYSSVVTRLHKTNKRVEHLLAWGLKAHQID